MIHHKDGLDIKLVDLGLLGGLFDSIKIVPSSSSDYIYALNSKKTQINLTQSFRNISTGTFEIKARGIYRISYSYSYITGGITQCVYNLNITSNGFSKSPNFFPVISSNFFKDSKISVSISELIFSPSS